MPIYGDGEQLSRKLGEVTCAQSHVINALVRKFLGETKPEIVTCAKSLVSDLFVRKCSFPVPRSTSVKLTLYDNYVIA
jgi:hypothetical protein